MLFYDYEVFRNDWLVVIMDTDTQAETIFVNDVENHNEFYHQHKNDIWVGYNSNGYDKYILKAIVCGFNPKEVNDWIIVKHKKGWEFSGVFNQIQLFNYDVMVKRAYSLKQLEAFMGHDIRETTVPFNIERKLTNIEIKETIHYCRHDVQETMEVFANQQMEFDSHLSLLKEFQLPLKNISKTQAQLAATILDAQKKKVTDEHEIILPNNLQINKYIKVIDFFKKYNDKNKDLNINISGVPHIFAGGGVHGAISKFKYSCKKDEYMIMADVDQLYPTIMIEYDLLSRAVKQPQKFKDILQTSLKLKAAGKKKEREPFKRICNITYGSEGDKYNPMFDPRNRLLVCIFGQLLLLDLIEKLEIIPSYQLIQSNTDGILVRIRKEDFDQFDDIVYHWEERTHLHMTFDFYKKIYQKDVNNYLVVDHDGKYKSKGAYVKSLNSLDYDLPIVNEAVVNYFVNGTSVKQTINTCDKLIKFQKVTKISGKYDYALYGKKKRHERVFRLFASKSGKALRKVKNDSIQKISYTPEVCKIVNTDVTNETTPGWLDRHWYIALAQKRIKDFTE
ncbi:hypothetical protein QQG09_06495 [Melissococcus plutonius]|uniref:hypothetical protein n=1 Tax=Melissococcus plutonius TaxID=33970 RepID=UPI0021E5A865|nr:hypothetical protein [Melissococcus plutonius]MCV2499609.1 hypothetical protein [Melissococcus plutonius]MCV2501529.1 hypothetical protein [Melissococcus plutonius]MCV2505970.1 hypothetical protein [Melissococcus plutonius]MCV2508211.1 hypothetical protein [Melissococcus plutonius]MCV2520001.1 hypothetical protein [Melissococcus plutonius]